jgi:hypothetical protein
METKQSIETVTADLRVLNELASKTADKDTWLTPAFWTMAAAAATNLITVAVLIGWVDAANAEGLTKSATALIGAAQVIVVNSVLVWKYIAGQNEVQIQKMSARYHYMEAIAVEKLRAKE